MRCDCHNDSALFLREHASLWQVADAQLDFYRARQVLDAAFFAIWIDERKYKENAAEEFRRIFDLLLGDIAVQETVTPLLWREQLDTVEDDKLLALISMEGAAPLAANSESLIDYFTAGLRAVGLTWNLSNNFAGSAFEGGGLRPAGIALVQACNQLGILLDAAHSSSETLHDLLRYSNKPIIDSHTVCGTLCADYPRAVSDHDLQELAAHGGVACICFVPDFLGGSGDLEQVCTHIEYAVRLIDSTHVAIGGDLDGCQPHADLADVSAYPRLLERLRARGMAEADIANVAGESVRKLLQQVLPARREEK